MKAAVVEKIWCAVGRTRSSDPNAWTGAGTRASICYRSMSHRSACCGRGLAGQAHDASHSRPRRSRNRRSYRGGGYALERRRPRGNRMAPQRVRALQRREVGEVGRAATLRIPSAVLRRIAKSFLSTWRHSRTTTKRHHPFGSCQCSPVLLLPAASVSLHRLPPRNRESMTSGSLASNSSSVNNRMLYH